MLGVEADLTFPNYCRRIDHLRGSRPTSMSPPLDYVATARGRLGYAAGHWLFYATGGLAFAGEPTSTTTRLRYAAAARSSPISAGPRAPASNMPSRRIGPCGSNITTSTGARDIRSSRTARSVRRRWIPSRCRIGLNCRLGGTGAPAGRRRQAHRCRNRPAGKSTARPPSCRRAIRAFRAPYEGTNSLPRRRPGAATWSNERVPQHAALGRRRGLLQSGTAAGLWPQQHRSALPASPMARRKRAELPFRKISSAALVSPPDLWLRRRAGRGCRAAACSLRARSTSIG